MPYPSWQMPGGEPGQHRVSGGAYSARLRRFLPFTVYRRDLLRRDMIVQGPCLVEEDAATTVLDAGARVTVDRYGSLEISLVATE